jgi:hypothetical protein
MPDAPEDSDSDPVPQGQLDPTTLRTMGHRAESHPLTESWRFHPDSTSPRFLELRLDPSTYPADVDDARLEIRWFVTDDYSLHYVETRGDERYQCRWDRHPKTDAPRTHFHSPPDAGAAVDSPLDPHHLEVLFAVLDWVSERIQRLHAEGDGR